MLWPRRFSDIFSYQPEPVTTIGYKKYVRCNLAKSSTCLPAALTRLAALACKNLLNVKLFHLLPVGQGKPPWLSHCA